MSGKVQNITEYNEWSQLHHSSGLFCAWIGRDRSVIGGGPGEVSRGLGPGEPWAWSGGQLAVEKTQCLKQRVGRGRFCIRLPSGSLVEQERLVAEDQAWLLHTRDEGSLSR